MPYKEIEIWEPFFFIVFGLFHMHRIWGLIDRVGYANFRLSILNNRGILYFVIMGILASLCIIGIITFLKNIHKNFWWRWIYIFGGTYLLFDLCAILFRINFWYDLLNIMFNVNSSYWNFIWILFILLGLFSFILGIKLIKDRRQKIL